MIHSIVLVLVVVMNGNVFIVAKGGSKMVEYETVQACEVDQKADSAALAKEPKMQQYDKWFLSCMTKQSVEDTLNKAKR